jgi:hypothetical protein
MKVKESVSPSGKTTRVFVTLKSGIVLDITEKEIVAIDDELETVLSIAMLVGRFPLFLGP